MGLFDCTSCGDLGERKGHFVVVIAKMKIMSSLEEKRSRDILLSVRVSDKKLLLSPTNP